MTLKWIVFLTITLILQTSLYSQDKTNKFSFAEAPKITKLSKDNYQITFEVKDFCDATVYIKDNNQKTIRHLASGVLGKNAPTPFQADQKKQTIFWDAKDDSEKLVDNAEELQLVVCLGLQPQFERTLYWSPHKRTKKIVNVAQSPILIPCKEGVMTYDGENAENLKLFDHDGNYVKTIFPLPAKSISQDTGYHMKKFPQDNSVLPQKAGFAYNQLLTVGNFEADKALAYHRQGDPEGITIHNDQIYLAQKRLNIIDLSKNKIDLNGPQLWKEVSLPQSHEYRGGVEKLAPTSLAVNTEGTNLYMAGYMYQRRWNCGGLNGVMKLNLKTKEPPVVFVGSMDNKKGVDNKSGFSLAACVAVDKKNNVFVGDYGNHLVKVYKEDGALIKSIPVEFPTYIVIHPETQEIYVFSWLIPYIHPIYEPKIYQQIQSTLTIFKSLDDPTIISTYSLPVTKSLTNGPGVRAAVDFYASEPRIWLSDPAISGEGVWYGKEDKANIKIYRIKDKEFELIKDFHAEAKKLVQNTRGITDMKQRLYCDYKNEKLIVGELFDPTPIHCTSMAEITTIDINTGDNKYNKLPLDAEELAFDTAGLIYLKTKTRIARFDPNTWKEIPFDYGNEYDKLSTHDIVKGDVVSAIPFECDWESSSQLGGMAISPKGDIAVTIYNATPETNKGIKIYPGRSTQWQIKVWNKRGQVVNEDAVTGIGRLVGINVDAKDNLYFMIAGKGKVNKETYYHPISCTYVKAKPGSRFINSIATIPLPSDQKPKREPDIIDSDYAGNIWAEGADWLIGGVGFDGKRHGCHCPSQSRPALDLYARSFLPEIDRYSILVVDSNGNEILRFGRYGNVDDGMPLIKTGGPDNPKSIGGDEIALLHCQMLAVQSNKRVFLGDVGNSRIVSVVLKYQEVKEIPIK